MKYPDWECRLARYVDSCAHRQFLYGTFDCVIFAAGAVQAQVGVYPVAGLKYEDRNGARETMRRFGRNLIAATTAVLGPSMPALMARRGDVVAVKHDGGGTCLGLLALDGWSVLYLEKQGLGVITLDRCTHAWRVE